MKVRSPNASHVPRRRACLTRSRRCDRIQTLLHAKKMVQMSVQGVQENIRCGGKFSQHRRDGLGQCSRRLRFSRRFHRGIQRLRRNSLCPETIRQIARSQRRRHQPHPDASQKHSGAKAQEAESANGCHGIAKTAHFRIGCKTTPMSTTYQRRRGDSSGCEVYFHFTLFH